MASRRVKHSVKHTQNQKKYRGIASTIAGTPQWPLPTPTHWFYYLFFARW